MSQYAECQIRSVYPFLRILVDLPGYQYTNWYTVFCSTQYPVPSRGDTKFSTTSRANLKFSTTAVDLPVELLVLLQLQYGRVYACVHPRPLQYLQLAELRYQYTKFSMTQLDLAPQSFESSTTVPMESTYVRYKSLFKFTFAPCEYANYYKKFTQVLKMISKSPILVQYCTCMNF